jgi:ribosomal protein L22
MVPHLAMRNLMTINQGRLITQQMGMMSMLQRAQFSTANAP